MVTGIGERPARDFLIGVAASAATRHYPVHAAGGAVEERDGPELLSGGWRGLHLKVVADSTYEAMRAMYSYRGWGEYQPMLRDDGTLYPNDEDEDYVPPER